MPHDLLFAYDFPPMGGGISRWMEALACGYPPGTLVVSTGSIAGAEASDAQFPNAVDRVGVPSDRLKTLPGVLRWSRRAVQLARDPAARFAWCGTLRPAATPAWWASKRTGLPYGVVFHGGDLLILRRKLERSPARVAQYRALLEGAAVLLCNSVWTADLLGETLSMVHAEPQSQRSRVITPGTDPARFAGTENFGSQFRSVRSLPDGRWLVTVARLVPHKGIDQGIRVFATLAAQYPDLRYAIVGNGPYESALRLLTTQLGVADRVYFLTDVTDAELPSAYALGTVYLGLSRQEGDEVEGFGISFLEAAAMELPVVAGKSGGTADAVEHGETGILVEPTDIEAAANAVGALLDDSSMASALGAAGRARVLRAHTWQHTVDAFNALGALHGRKP